MRVDLGEDVTVQGTFGLLTFRKWPGRCFIARKVVKFVVESKRDGKSHVAAGRKTRQSDLVSIDAKFFRMVVDVEDRVHTILNSSGKGTFRRETVVDTDDDGMALVHNSSTPPRIIARRAQGETTTVEIEHDRISAPPSRTCASPPYTLSHLRKCGTEPSRLPVQPTA